MKSIKEKAEAYDSIIEKANKMHSENCVDCKACIEELIPELAEYEDEKVRKELIDAVQGLWDNDALPMPLSVKRKDEWLAWLEKQKGNVGGISSNWSEEDEEYNGEDYGIDSLYHAQRILEKTLGSVEGYQSDDGILEHKCAISAVKKLYEQNPAWSEEDKGIIEEVVSYLINYSNIVESKEDANRIEYLIDKIQDICPHQKQAWSEEDEKIINGLIDSLTRISLNTRTDSTSPNYTFYKEIDWLKSLRPQNKWKPSSEQIKVCKEVYADILSAKGFDLGTVVSELNRLEEELKKKGE